MKRRNDFAHITLPITGEAGARTQVSRGLSVPLLFINAELLLPGPCCKGPLPYSLPGISGADALSQAQIHSRHHNPEASCSFPQDWAVPLKGCKRGPNLSSSLPSGENAELQRAPETPATPFSYGALCACLAAQCRQHSRGRRSGKARQ